MSVIPYLRMQVCGKPRAVVEYLRRACLCDACGNAPSVTCEGQRVRFCKRHHKFEPVENFKGKQK